jgi:hypothetical protein
MSTWLPALHAGMMQSRVPSHLEAFVRFVVSPENAEKMKAES